MIISFLFRRRFFVFFFFSHNVPEAKLAWTRGVR